MTVWGESEITLYLPGHGRSCPRLWWVMWPCRCFTKPLITVHWSCEWMWSFRFVLWATTSPSFNPVPLNQREAAAVVMVILNVSSVSLEFSIALVALYLTFLFVLLLWRRFRSRVYFSPGHFCGATKTITATSLSERGRFITRSFALAGYLLPFFCST